MSVIKLSKINDVFLRVHSDTSIAYELSEYFTFNVPGAKFSPAYRNKLWDGKIRLFHLGKRTLYVGLIDHVKRFAEEREYELEYDNLNDFASEEFSEVQADKLIQRVSPKMEPRDYQRDAFIYSVRNKRALLLSPTASGKSLIIYLLSCLLYKRKVLIIVPTLSLVHQMASDFEDYGCPKQLIHKIYGGQEKETDLPFVITTWQSIYEMPKSWFQPFGVVIGDEAHLFKSKSLVTIMEKLTACSYRFGFTGTLDGTLTNKLVLEGLFGPVRQVTTTTELMSNNTLATLNIKAIVLSHLDETRQLFAKNKTLYKNELDYLFDSESRNQFIGNLLVSLKGNSLLLFNNIKHGKILVNTIKQLDPSRDVYFVYGGVEGEERERVRGYVENSDNAIIVASYKTFSTGVNIQKLHNVVFGSPSKSRVRVLQSIGRGLRKNEEKVSAVLYDIADDISWKSYKNHTIRHFMERVTMYNQEKFDYKIYAVNLKRSL